MSLDRRKMQRARAKRPVLLSAKGMENCHCIADEISDIGARLTFVMPHDLPDKFNLKFLGKNQKAMDCVVVWRTDRQFGVRFLR